MSQQIIEVLDYLFEKFGIAVDWTAENVMPYVQELAGKIVKYNIVVDAVWIAVSFLGFTAACIYFGTIYSSYRKCKTTKEDTLIWTYYGHMDLDDLNPMAGIFGVVAAVVTIVSIIVIGCACEDLLRWIFIPELQLIEYISNLVNNIQM